MWSIDIDAVLTAMSCFRLLCEEAEIRCGADELAVTQLLPNYTIYSELESASTVLTTGMFHYFISSLFFPCHLMNSFKIMFLFWNNYFGY